MYDAKIGRWTTMDPAAQFYSTYLAMGNNPILAIDPDGAWAGGTDPDPPETNVLGPLQFDNEDAWGAWDFNSYVTTSSLILPPQIDQAANQVSIADYETINRLDGMLKQVENMSVIPSVAQLSMMYYLQNLNIHNKIGTFSKFSQTYNFLGKASSKLTYVGVPIAVVREYR